MCISYFSFGCRGVLRFSLTIKMSPQYKWNSVESGVKHSRFDYSVVYETFHLLTIIRVCFNTIGAMHINLAKASYNSHFLLKFV